MIDIMVDIETLGRKPNSVITSIGAVVFNIETGEILSKFHQNICPISCEKYGLTVDLSTIMWWMGQVNKPWTEDPKDINVVLSDLSDFVSEAVELNNFRVWANSPAFDLVLLKTAYEKVLNMKKSPWNFRNEMCVRTLNNMFPEVRASITVETSHDALDDCIQQIKWVVEIWKKIYCNVY